MPRWDTAQPVLAGLVSAVVGYASSFAVVLAGLQAVGASPAQAASGLLALCTGIAVLAIGLSLRHRMPISIAWSTPGAALLVAAGADPGGFPAAVGAFLVCGVLIVLAGGSCALLLQAAHPSVAASTKWRGSAAIRSDCETMSSAIMKFGTVSAIRRVSPCSASIWSTSPWGSPVSETTKCSASQ